MKRSQQKSGCSFTSVRMQNIKPAFIQYELAQPSWIWGRVLASENNLVAIFTAGSDQTVSKL